MGKTPPTGLVEAICVVCNKPFWKHAKVKNFPTAAIGRKSNSVTCSPRCSRSKRYTRESNKGEKT